MTWIPGYSAVSTRWEENTDQLIQSRKEKTKRFSNRIFSSVRECLMQCSCLRVPARVCGVLSHLLFFCFGIWSCFSLCTEYSPNFIGLYSLFWCSPNTCFLLSFIIFSFPLSKEVLVPLLYYISSRPNSWGSTTPFEIHFLISIYYNCKIPSHCLWSSPRNRIYSDVWYLVGIKQSWLRWHILSISQGPQGATRILAPLFYFYL